MGESPWQMLCGDFDLKFFFLTSTIQEPGYLGDKKYLGNGNKYRRILPLRILSYRQSLSARSRWTLPIALLGVVGGPCPFGFDKDCEGQAYV